MHVSLQITYAAVVLLALISGAAAAGNNNDNGNKPDKGSGLGIAVVTRIPNVSKCLSVTYSPSGGPTSYNVNAGSIYKLSITGPTDCPDVYANGAYISKSLIVTVKNTQNGNRVFTATSTTDPNVFEVNVPIRNNSCFTSPIVYCGSDIQTRTSETLNNTVHFRASTFQQAFVGESTSDCGGFGDEKSTCTNRKCPPCRAFQHLSDRLCVLTHRSYLSRDRNMCAFIGLSFQCVQRGHWRLRMSSRHPWLR